MNRALAAKTRKARDQSRAYAITMDMAVRSRPTTSKGFTRWMDSQLWLVATNPDDVKHLNGRRRTAQDELLRFVKREETHNAATQQPVVLRKVSQETKMVPTGKCHLHYSVNGRSPLPVPGSWSTTRYQCMIEIGCRMQWEDVDYGLAFSPREDGMSRQCATSRVRYVIVEDMKKVPASHVTPVTQYDLSEDNSMRW